MGKLAHAAAYYTRQKTPSTPTASAIQATQSMMPTQNVSRKLGSALGHHHAQAALPYRLPTSSRPHVNASKTLILRLISQDVSARQDLFSREEPAEYAWALAMVGIALAQNMLLAMTTITANAGRVQSLTLIKQGANAYLIVRVEATVANAIPGLS